MRTCLPVGSGGGQRVSFQETESLSPITRTLVEWLQSTCRPVAVSQCRADQVLSPVARVMPTKGYPVISPDQVGVA